MNAVDLQREMPKSIDNDQDLAYRSISKAAVVSVIFAFLGLIGFLAPIFCVIALLGMVFGFIGMMNVNRYPQELVGKKAAIFGLVFSLICFVSASGLHAYIYATEVPEGYERISFYQLRPNKLRPDLKYAEVAEEWDGKKVFLKGYVRPGTKKTDLKDFILVGDFGSCCFGGNPKITDIVAINIETDQTVDYSLRVRKVTGEFRLNKNTKQHNEKDIPAIVYEIVADKVR